jgi:hypothetical protein
MLQVLGSTSQAVSHLDEALFRIDKVVGWKDHDSGFGIMGTNPGQAQENACRSFPIGWLKDQLAGDPPLRSTNPVRPVQRVLEHGAGPDEGAILLGLGLAEPSLNERLEPSPPARTTDHKSLSLDASFMMGLPVFLREASFDSSPKIRTLPSIGVPATSVVSINSQTDLP